jgi:serine/threonine protein kinase/Flp pilus assembly protein TadD
MSGRTIAHYRILKKIGEGGMGEVFLAEDTKLDRNVALKTLSHPSPSEELLARFEREAKAAAALDHPNILSIHDFGREGPISYVVMELLEGRTLREIIEEGPLHYRRAVGYGLEIAQGLAAAHDKGIHHRDLKPENIFITRDDRVKILDFGLAGIRASERLEWMRTTEGATRDRLTVQGAIVGTTGYMAPEQVRGEDADHRSDIFALGALLFELLAGQRAFREPTRVETMHAILKKAPPVALLEDARVPAAVIQIVSRCLEKNPEDRFQSARDLAFALQTVSAAGSSPSGSGASTAREAGAPLTRFLGGRSIAVLPFANMSADAETEYFSDGVTEDIINALAQLPDLRVAARTSSFAFKGKNLDISEVGARLRVDTILEGSVRRAGNRLRITAQLIEVANGYHLWSERYDRELTDVFAIQDDIATNIASKLSITLSGAGGDPLVKRATQDMEAYDLYLKGRYFVEQRGAGIIKGLEFFNRAIAVDPRYALAYAGLAESLSLLVVYSVAAPAEQMPRAKAAATRALELDDRLAEAHNAMALVSLLYDWDWARAETEFDRALEINPNFVPARYWKGLLYLLFVQGRAEEAIAEILRAVELDPMATLPVYALGLALIGAGRYPEAITRAQGGLKQDPTSFLLHRLVGTASLCQSRYEEAIASLEKGLALSMRHPFLLADLGAAYAALGKTSEAEKLQEEMIARSKASFMSPVALSVIPLALGRMEEAVGFLELAFEQRDPMLVATRVWPILAPAARHDRVRGLLEQMGLQRES